MKRHAPRVTALAAATALALTGCTSADGSAAEQSKGPAADAETIEYGLLAGKPYDGEEITFVICCSTAAQFASWRASTEEFTELTGITVNFTDDPLDGLREKIVTQSVADPGSWDAAIYFDTWLPELTGFLEPLENVMPVDLADYPEATADLSAHDGKIYGIPARSHVMMLHYRADVFEELGLAVPETYDDILEAAETIDSSDLGIAGFTTNWAKQPSISPIPWISLVQSGGGSIFTEDGDADFTSSEVIAATGVYRQLAEYAPSGAVAYNEGDSRNAYAQGKAAMTLAWSWAHEIFTSQDAHADVRENASYSSVIPAADGPGDPIAMTWPIGISSSSNHKGAAAEWLKWLTNPDLDRDTISDKSDPALSTVVANRLSSLQSAEANAPEANDGFSAAMADAYSRATHQPVYTGFASVSEIIEVALSEIMSGADIKSTLKAANDQAQAALDRAK